MIAQRLTVAAGVVGLFIVALLVFFPTDAILHAALPRVTPPGRPILVFRSAAMRPWGLVLNEPALRRADGTALLNLDWLRLRPSLLGLVRDHTGAPWQVTAGACGGTGEAIVNTDGPAMTAALAWRDLDLGGCPPLAIAGNAFAGRAEGAANLRLAPGVQPSGEGTIQLRGALWRSAGVFGLEALHAETAFLRWQLADGRLTLGAIDLHGPELRATGTGAVRLARSLGRSAVDFRFAVAPGPEAPPLIRGLLGTLPPSGEQPGAYRLTVTGTADALRVVR